MREEIEAIKKKRNAVILTHVYQRGEVQDIADYVGDSLDLSKKAVSTKSDVIVFCGVQFMAETASILNPGKIVLLPDKNAGCGLADMATVEQLRYRKKQYPRAAVVSYINSSAAIKAESDICCTSANAVAVVNSLPQDQVLFIPDRNLGSYVAEQSSKDIVLWDGYCYVHESITIDQLKSLKEQHPSAEIILHPECPASLRHMANFIGSTSQMSRYAGQSKHNEFIVGTEINFVYRLKTDNPDKIFYPGSKAYSMATAGCNFHCRFCQNWSISQIRNDEVFKLGQNISPENIVLNTKEAECQTIAYTYTEPTIFFEYCYDTARIARKAGLKNIYVTNGYMTDEMLAMLSPYLDAVNIDLKAFQDKAYRRITGGRLQPVLDNLKKMKQLGIWLEVTSLIIPGINDDPHEIRDIANFVVKELGSDVPWHISRFFPAYKMKEVPVTPLHTLQVAKEINHEVGAHYVYLGNVKNNIKDDCCPNCGKEIAGVGLSHI